MNDKTLRVIYSSDNNYAQHMGVSMYSLLETNSSVFERIYVYIIDNHISADNKNKLRQIISDFNNSEIFWISFDEYVKTLKLNMAWNISISSYARLFVSSMLPQDVNRVLYLDSDIIVRSSLYDLWNTDIGNHVLGAVQDTINDSIKEPVGLKGEEQYFNSGMLLIDLNNWRANDVENRCMDFIRAHNGRVIHHDQGVLNGVLKNEKYILPLKYNVMTIIYFFNRFQLMKRYKDHSGFYSENEIENAKKEPVMLHYTPSYTTRPWVNSCKHPLKQYYFEMLSKTPWKSFKAERDSNRMIVKIINFLYRNFPSFMLGIFYRDSFSGETK